jgi:hypothetical protein
MNNKEIKEALIKLNEKIDGMTDEELLAMIEEMDKEDSLYQALMFLFSDGYGILED